MGEDMTNKMTKMTRTESEKYAKQVDSYIKRTAPRVQEQLEHLIDAALKLHEPDYTPASVKGRIDSQPRDDSIRDYFLDGNIFLSVELPTMDFDKNERSVISMSFGMFDKDGKPVNDNEVLTTGRDFDPLLDYSLVVKLITRFGEQRNLTLLDPKDFTWPNSVDWYKLNGEIMTMDDDECDSMIKIFYEDLFLCFFKDVHNAH